MCKDIYAIQLYFIRKAITYLFRQFFILSKELFGNLTVLSGIRNLCCVQDMNCHDASPATVDTVFYCDSHTMAENGKHFLENDGLVEFRGVGLPCFTCRSLQASQSIIVVQLREVVSILTK